MCCHFLLILLSATLLLQPLSLCGRYVLPLLLFDYYMCTTPQPPSNTNLKLQIRYKAATSNSYRYRTVFASSSTYTLTGLQSETNYSIQVRSGFFLSSEYGGNCPRNLFGKFSDHLLALTVSEGICICTVKW